MSSAKPKLTYFDVPASRGEECRLALHIAGVDFEDVRVKNTEWPAVKPTTPFGTVPCFELPDRPPLGQSNAILVYIGKSYGLHPQDLFEAAQHEELMSYVEELRHHVGQTLRMSAEDKQRTREALASSYIPAWGANVEKHLVDGPFVAGGKLHVVDLKLYMIVRWFAKGTLDHIPATIFDGYPKLVRLYEAVANHEGVKSWYAKT